MAFAPLVAMGMAVAASAVSAMSTMRAGAAQKNAAEYNAKVAEMNADQARDAAAAEAFGIEEAGRRTQGTVRARAAASGLLLEEGSPIEILAANAANIERERAGAIYRGEVAARGFEQRAVLDRYAGNQARQQSYFAAGSTLLGSVGRAVGIYGSGLDLGEGTKAYGNYAPVAGSRTYGGPR